MTDNEYFIVCNNKLVSFIKKCNTITNGLLWPFFQVFFIFTPIICSFRISILSSIWKLEIEIRITKYRSLSKIMHVSLLKREIYNYQM